MIDSLNQLDEKGLSALLLLAQLEIYAKAWYNAKTTNAPIQELAVRESDLIDICKQLVERK